jgi:hypothetical protein
MALLLFAADAGRGAQDPGTGLSALLIVAVLVGVVLMAALLFGLFHRLSRSSRGGTQPRRREFRRGEPPFEGVARKR